MSVFKYNLSDYNHELEKHCSIEVNLDKLSVSLHYSLEINEDYLDEDAEDNPEPYQFSDNIYFDKIANLNKFVRSTLLNLANVCYRAWTSDGNEVDDIEEIIEDFEEQAKTLGTPAFIEGNNLSNKVTINDIEKAYGLEVPEPIKDFLNSDAWKRYEGCIINELPEYGGVGLTTPVPIVFLGKDLVTKESVKR